MSLLLSFDNLKNTVDKKVFTEAMELYNINLFKVKDIDVTSLNTFTTYKCNIVDPYSNELVELEVIIENINDKHHLEYFNCSCEKFMFENICSHTVAFILFIMNQYKISKVKTQVNTTSREQRMQNELINFLSVDKKVINIKLIPIFIIKKQEMFLRLKIGNEKLYIIQNIIEFINRVFTLEFASYGKDLEFTHTIDCFEDKSQKLIELLNMSDFSNQTKNKELKLSSKIIYNILLLFKDDIINIEYQNNEYSINNNLLEKPISINADENQLVLDDLNLFYYFTTSNGIIGFDKENSFFTSLNNYELKLFLMFKDNVIPINLVKDQFMTNIYPNVKNIVSLNESLKNEFPDFHLIIESYFDFNDGRLTLNSKFLEQNVEVSEKHVSSLNKHIVNKYNQLLETYNIFKKEITDIDDIVLFTEKDLSAIKEFGPIFLSSALNNLNVKQVPKVTLKANYNVNLIELNVESEYSSRELEKLINAYKKKEKYVQLKDNVIVRINDDVNDIIDMVDDYDLDYKNLGETVSKPDSFILKFFNDEDIIIDDKIYEIIEEIKNYKKSSYNVPKSLKNILRNYQVEAFKWLKIITKHKFGAVLADDMGLGKTLEILTLILDDDSNTPSLIVAPTSLLYNWYNECTKWCSNIEGVIISGTSSFRENRIKLIKNEKVIYITSYDSLVRDIDFYKQNFRFLIIDEAQYIKNPTTKKSLCIKKINSEIKIALTGTPVENSLADLWSIFDFILPGYLSNYNHFQERYERLIMNNDQVSLNALKSKIMPFILRRTKKQVLKDLPEKTEEIYFATLGDEQKKLYDAHINKIKLATEGKSKIEILSMITRLRQICVAPSMFLSDYNHPDAKIDLTMELINKAISGNHKILIFSQFTKALDILEEKLDSLDISNLILTGSTKSKERQDLVNEFNNNDNIKVFLISLKAGGTGLNLVSADVVIHLDPWWNLSAESQATDRAHRMGQKNNVTVIKIVCANTIEERVLLLQERKSKLATSIIDDDIDLDVSTKDLDFLLQ